MSMNSQTDQEVAKRLALHEVELEERKQINEMKARNRPLPDEVNHPTRYTKGKIECIDAIEAAVVGKTPGEAVLIAPIIKYLFRYEDKGGVEDARKAHWYLQRLIKLLDDRNKNL